MPQRETDRRQGDRSLPVRTPTMAGGLFSIDREYFHHIGAYDEGMQIWGGENLEVAHTNISPLLCLNKIFPRCSIIFCYI